MKGKKLVAFCGKAKCTIEQFSDGTISGGASNCTQALYDVYKRARLIADPRNDGDMNKVKAILESGGWEVYWD